MDTKTNNKLKILLLGLVSFVLTAFISGFAYAFLADGDTAVNKLDIGSVSTEITEEFENPVDIYPGQEITKNVVITNNGPCSCYVRVQVLFSDSIMKEKCTLDMNYDDWEEKDGWFYYRHILYPGMQTSSLFTKVSINNNAEEIHPFAIYVRQESYQSGGYADCFLPWM